MKDYMSPAPDIIIAGDFNFPRAMWKHGIGEAYGNTRYEKSSLQLLIDLASNLNLIQKVTFGTRKSRAGNHNILELIFTNNHDLITNIYGEHSEISDHDYIVCETSHDFSLSIHESVKSEDTNLSSYNYLKADWVKLRAKLREINWIDTLKNYTTSAEKINMILEIVSKIIDEHCVKFKYPRGKPRSNIPKARRKLLRNKKKLKTKLKKKNVSNNRKMSIKNTIIDIDKQLLTSHQNERNIEEINAIRNMKVNP